MARGKEAPISAFPLAGHLAKLRVGFLILGFRSKLIQATKLGIPSHLPRGLETGLFFHARKYQVWLLQRRLTDTRRPAARYPVDFKPQSASGSMSLTQEGSDRPFEVVQVIAITITQPHECLRLPPHRPNPEDPLSPLTSHRHSTRCYFRNTRVIEYTSTCSNAS